MHKRFFTWAIKEPRDAFLMAFITGLSVLALVSVLSRPAYAAAPTATVNAYAFGSDTTRRDQQGQVVQTIGDINVSVLGTSTAVAKVSGGTGTAWCEGFSGVAAQLQRASVDPYGPEAAYVQWSSFGSALAANGSVAVAEAGIGWYRWNITSVTGTGNCLITWTNK